MFLNNARFLSVWSLLTINYCSHAIIALKWRIQKRFSESTSIIFKLFKIFVLFTRSLLWPNFYDLQDINREDWNVFLNHFFSLFFSYFIICNVWIFVRRLRMKNYISRTKLRYLTVMKYANYLVSTVLK